MKKTVFVTMIALMCAAMMFSAMAETVGGWTAAEDPAVTDEARAALDKALEGLVGATYEPVALLGTQVVAGTNYCLLCRVSPVVPDPVGHYALVYVYAGVDGTCKLLGTADLDVGGMMPELAD